MSFRIHSSSLELKRDLERKLAELQGQFDEGFEYEISAEMVQREDALPRAGELARTVGAESVFVAEGIFATEKPQEDDDPDFAMGLPNVGDRNRTADESATPETKPVENVPEPQVRSPRIDAQKIRDAAKVTAAQAHTTLQRAGEQTASALKVTRESTTGFVQVAGNWFTRQSQTTKTISAGLKRDLEARSSQWKAAVAQRNAQRLERQRVESEARRERERVAHREAEFAAISAQIMREQQKKENARRMEPQPKIEPKPAPRPVVKRAQPEERDTWPVWRNAFVAAACIALVGIFLLATGGKQSSAAPATSTELTKPAVVVRAHAAEERKTLPAIPAVAAKIPAKPATKPVAAKRAPRVRQNDDDFQEVTVHHYSNASILAAPKKNAKGVVQISDME